MKMLSQSNDLFFFSRPRIHTHGGRMRGGSHVENHFALRWLEPQRLSHLTPTLRCFSRNHHSRHQKCVWNITMGDINFMAVVGPNERDMSERIRPISVEPEITQSTCWTSLRYLGSLDHRSPQFALIHAITPSRGPGRWAPWFRKACVCWFRLRQDHLVERKLEQKETYRGRY